MIDSTLTRDIRLAPTEGEHASLARSLDQQTATWPDPVFLSKHRWSEATKQIFLVLAQPDPTGEREYWAPSYLRFATERLGGIRRERLRGRLPAELRSDDVLNVAILLLDTVSSGHGMATSIALKGVDPKRLEAVLDHLQSALELLLPVQAPPALVPEAVPEPRASVGPAI